MKIVRLIIPLIVLLVFQSCKTTPEGVNIDGKLIGAENLTIYLDKLGPSNTNESLLNNKANGNGSFSFNLPMLPEAGLYRVRAGAKSVDLILDGSESAIKIEGNLNGISKFEHTVSGSPKTEQFLNTVRGYMDKSISTEELRNIATKDADPLIAYTIATKMFTMRPDFADLHMNVSKRMSDTYPQLSLSANYAKQAQALEQQYKRQLASQKIKVGELAPNISLPGPDGKMRQLSDYKGKVVLLDFWASWCGPCRKANPKVVEAYKKYNKKGFDVFSVSLDGLDDRTKARYTDQSQIDAQLERSKKRWEDAIAKDNLIWDGHVSDLKKWNSGPAGEYGVRSIPKTFLIDREGKIAVINPRYNLEEELVKYL